MRLGLDFKMEYNNVMNFLKTNWQKLILSSFYFFLPVFVVFADQGGTVVDPCLGKICNPIPDITSIPGLVQVILEGALKVGIPLIALAVIYCGFLFVKAQGKEEELTKAKDALLYTVIGAGILLGSWAIAEMIQSTVNALK